MTKSAGELKEGDLIQGPSWSDLGTVLEVRKSLIFLGDVTIVLRFANGYRFEQRMPASRAVVVFKRSNMTTTTATAGG